MTSTITSEVTRIKQKVTEAYDVCRTAGVSLSSEYQPIANLANTIEQINKPVLGLMAHNILGPRDGTVLGSLQPFDWVATGMTTVPANLFSDAFSGTNPKLNPNSISWPDVTTIEGLGCNQMCKNNTIIKSFSAPNLTTVGEKGCYWMCGCGLTTESSLESVDLSSLANITADNAFESAFQNATSLTSANISNLTTVTSERGAYGMFRNTNVNISSLPNLVSVSGVYGMAFFLCENLAITEFTFPKLESVTGKGGIGQFFTRSTNLQKIYFPALTTVVDTALGDNLGNGMCNGCTGVTEIHFKASIKSQIEATTTYSEKFGAENATIYFDL